MSSNKHVVIVEDNEDLANALKETLSERGFQVTLALDGESGLELIKNEKPQLLVLDTILPGMSGLDLLDGLIEYRKQNELKIIMLSNVDKPEELSRARTYDIDEYLVKTEWRMEDVIDKIKKYL